MEVDHTKLSFSFEAHKAQTMMRLRAGLRNEQQVRSLFIEDLRTLLLSSNVGLCQLPVPPLASGE